MNLIGYFADERPYVRTTAMPSQLRRPSHNESAFFRFGIGVRDSGARAHQLHEFFVSRRANADQS
jgi:hypothetical protein